MKYEGTIYTFSSNSMPVTLHYFDGNEFLKETVNRFNLDIIESNFLRKIILSVQFLIIPLTPKEGLGIYIESPEISYKFSLETNNKGITRIECNTKDLFKSEQSTISCTIIIKNLLKAKSKRFKAILKNITINSLVATIFQHIFKIESHLMVSQMSNKSILITMLTEETDPSNLRNPHSISLKEYIKFNNTKIIETLKSELSEFDEIYYAFKKIGLILSHRKKISSSIPD